MEATDASHSPEKAGEVDSLFGQRHIESNPTDLVLRSEGLNGVVPCKTMKIS